MIRLTSINCLKTVYKQIVNKLFRSGLNSIEIRTFTPPFIIRTMNSENIFKTSQKPSHTVLENLQHINLRAAESYLKALENKQEIRIFESGIKDKKDLVCVIHYPECIGVYISLSNTSEEKSCFTEIIKIIQTIFLSYPRKKIRVTIPADNQHLLKQVQLLGCRQDYLGYEFCFNLDEVIPELPQMKEPVIQQAYSETFFEDYINLLDLAFNPLQIKSRSRTDRFRNSKGAVRQEMLEAAQNEQFVSFWRKGMLAGLYFGKGKILDIICVHPDLQNQGIGSYMLKNYKHGMAKKALKKVYLYVIQENEKAIRFYLKNDFFISSFFYEGKYQPGDI